VGLLRRRAQMLDLRVRRGQVLRRGFHQRPSAGSGERGGRGRRVRFLSGLCGLAPLSSVPQEKTGERALLTDGLRAWVTQLLVAVRCRGASVPAVVEGVGAAVLRAWLRSPRVTSSLRGQPPLVFTRGLTPPPPTARAVAAPLLPCPVSGVVAFFFTCAFRGTNPEAARISPRASNAALVILVLPPAVLRPREPLRASSPTGVQFTSAG